MEKSKRYIRERLRALLAILAVLAVVISVPAAIYAEGEPFDPEKTCSLTLKPIGTDDAAIIKDIAEAKVVADLYLVGRAVKDPNYDTYSYELTDDFKSLVIGDDWDEVESKASEIFFKNYKSMKPAKKDQKMGEAAEGLASGLYLVVARGAEIKDYVRTIKNEDGSEVSVTVAESGVNEYLYKPELISIPTKDPEDGKINTANKGDWVYDVTAVLKPEVNPMYGDLEIVKDLLTYKTGEEAFFVFEVEIEKDGKKYPSRIYTLSVNDAGKQSVIAHRIPAGATVTVTEKYSGATYMITSDPTQKAVISASEMVKVEFKNDYTTSENGGHGALNSFKYDSVKGWQWLKDGAETSGEGA